MQLYRIHPDPTENARLIGVYANKINVAEGLQQISDIGHCFGITWEGQYKASYVRTAHGTGKKYISHPLVMGHMQQRDTFFEMTRVVLCSLIWLKSNGHRKWCTKREPSWESFVSDGLHTIMDALPENRTMMQFQAEYLCEVKRFDARGKVLVKVVSYFGRENFIKTQINDLIKKNYCNREEIRFIEIPYWLHNYSNISKELNNILFDQGNFLW